MRGAIGQGLYQRSLLYGTDALEAAFPRFCRLCALPLPSITMYPSASADREQRRGIAMKNLGLILVVCAAMAGLAAGPASAFDIQGKSASLENEGAGTSATQFSSPVDQFLNPDYAQGSSLALPYIGKNDGSSFISDYGNMIAIPSPGIDRPAPLWSYR
jgi:hypothetical protein